MTRSRCTTMLAPAALLALTVGPDPAQASFPVPFAMVGCVTGGKFAHQNLTGADLSQPELLKLEGKTVRIEGWLSPGDEFVAQAVFVVDERCRTELHKRYFLCDPCATIPGHPPSTMVPKQEGGTDVALPKAAIDELRNINKRMNR
jgi:hypothetical protein